MSLTRAKRNFPANVERRVSPALSAVVSESVGKLSSLRSLRALLLNQPSLRDSEPPPSLPGVETPGYFREVPPGLRCATETLNFRMALGLVSHQPSAHVPSSHNARPALSLREEGFGAFRHHRLLRSQVVGRTIKAPPSPSQARRRNARIVRLSYCAGSCLCLTVCEPMMLASPPLAHWAIEPHSACAPARGIYSASTPDVSSVQDFFHDGRTPTFKRTQVRAPARVGRGNHPVRPSQPPIGPSKKHFP
jgi:hypothetical protein